METFGLLWLTAFAFETHATRVQVLHVVRAAVESMNIRQKSLPWHLG
jgi:hypothetical protein